MSKRILISASYAPSLINFRGKLIEMLAGLGHRVHVAAPDIDEPTRAALGALGALVHDVPLQRTGTSPLADLRYFRAMRRVIRANNIDLVFAYTIKPVIWSSLAAQAERTRSIAMVTGLGYAFEQPRGVKSRLVSGLSRLLYRRATRANRIVIFQNPDDRDDFIAAGCLGDPAKARLVDGSGVDLAHFRPQPLPAKPIFLMIARLLGAKGVREYGEAALRLIAENVDAEFRIAGFFDEGPDGVGRDEIDRMVAGGVRFLGKQDDVRGAIAAASVYVLPSYREGTPRTVLEAMAMGRPVITSDAPGCRETVRHGVTGLLVPPRDAGALAVAMRKLAADPALREQMGSASLAYCRERYDVDALNARMRELMEV